MISMKSALIACLGLAPFASSAAFASASDEFTLDPVFNSSPVVYTPQTSTVGSTIITQPSGSAQGETVNINDYIIQDDTTNSQ